MLRECRTDGVVECAFQLWQGIGIQPIIVKLAQVERYKFAPLIAKGKHLGEQVFAVGKVAVAVQEERAESLVEVCIVSSEEKKRSTCRFAMQRSGVC